MQGVAYQCSLCKSLDLGCISQNSQRKMLWGEKGSRCLLPPLGTPGSSAPTPGAEPTPPLLTPCGQDRRLRSSLPAVPPLRPSALGSGCHLGGGGRGVSHTQEVSRKPSPFTLSLQAIYASDTRQQRGADTPVLQQLALNKPPIPYGANFK